MDINPLNDGHTLVLVKSHAETLYDLSDADCHAAPRAARVVALGIREALQPEGLNLHQADIPAAYQSVSHFHLHLVPRWTNDGVGLDRPLKPRNMDRIRGAGEKIRRKISPHP